MKLRKSNRLPEYDYSNAGWYYVTTCLPVGRSVQKIINIISVRLKMIK